MIYICIPAHNEQDTIGVLLWKIRRVMGDFPRDYEVMVLDDASTDDTHDVVDRYRKTLPLRVLRRRQRLGYAGAVEALLREAVRIAPYPKRDSAVFLQGDFTESPDYIVPLIKTLEGGADVVAGVNQGGDNPAPRAVRFTRWAAGLLLGRGMREAPVSDPLSGLRAYRIVVLKKALRDAREGPLLKADGWATNVELLRAVASHARRIEEAPVQVRHELRVRPSRFRVMPTLRGLLELRKRLRWPSAGESAA